MPKTGDKKVARPSAELDYSFANDGYVVAAYTGDESKLPRMRIKCQGNTQDFIMMGGKPKAYPLCWGNGMYTIGVYRQIYQYQYSAVIALDVPVILSSEFSPYLYPNTYCMYNPLSACVRVSNGVCIGIDGDAGRVKAMERWIIDNVEYDTALAAKVQADRWWLPDPDEVVHTGKSICWGYSSLFAAMCRAKGIPCKIVVGRVNGGGKHAWNEAYVNGVWERHDVTLLDSRGYAEMEQIIKSGNYEAEYYG